MCVHGSQSVYCTTELCLSVDKLNEEKTTTRKERCKGTEVNVCVVYFLSTVQSENTYTPARLEEPFKSSQASPFLKRSAVLFFVSTRPTDRHFSRIHCSIAKHRIPMCLSPPGPLRCRMCLAESQSISR